MHRLTELCHAFDEASEQRERHKPTRHLAVDVPLLLRDDGRRPARRPYDSLVMDEFVRQYSVAIDLIEPEVEHDAAGSVRLLEQRTATA